MQQAQVMAPMDEPNVEELKQLLRRLERMLPPPDAAPVSAAISRRKPDAESVPDGSSPATAGAPQSGIAPSSEGGSMAAASSAASERTARGRSPFVRTGLATIVAVASVSALLSTAVTVMLVRGRLSPQIAGAENVSPSEPLQERVESSPASQAGIITPAPMPAPAAVEPAPVQTSTTDPAANDGAHPNAPVIAVERALAEPVSPPAPEPPQTLSSNAEADAPLPQQKAEKPEEKDPAPAQASEPAVAAATPPPVPPPAAAAAPDAAQYFQRGQLMLSSGNIGAARLLLERAAELGNGEAALLLGSTYDAMRTLELHAAGVTPNAGLARRWYERAAALGTEEARQRLQDLGKSRYAPADGGG